MTDPTPADIRILCDAEFGEDHDHNDVVCSQMLGTMGVFDDPDGNYYAENATNFDFHSIDYPEYDPEGDFYAATGRMAFPNEY